jgi:uncharacterized glyoxalase superfamily protein PhnB
MMKLTMHDILVGATAASVLGCAVLGLPEAAGETQGDATVKTQTSRPTMTRVTRAALLNTCIITNNVERLVAFYEPVLQQKATWSGKDYAEFATSVGVLAIFSSSAQEKYIPGSAKAAQNRSVILEFKVADVDAEFRRLQGIVNTWVKPPTTQPWGTRSVYFRDPDGNLINFFAPVSRP